MALVLASKSPRRRELFSLITPVFLCDEAGVDEAAVTADTPALLAASLARHKALAVALRRPVDTVIGCDTVVELDGCTLGKPAGEAGAAEMLARLSGRRHLVHTGVCVCLPGGSSAPGGLPASFVETTAVDFAPLPPQVVAAYVRTAEPYDKAGGYGIQGWAARYVVRIEGCYYNVMGLPVAALYRELLRLNALDDGAFQ